MFGDQVIRTDAHGWAFVGELKKREDGACVYLGPDGCGVYERRPKVCQDFQASDSCGYAADPLKVLGLVRLRAQR
jgi:Fe-S-cluster containining protein